MASQRSLAGAAALALVLAGGFTVSWTERASAQGICGRLWYERNSIYARNGYCFRTARARSVFGPGCFPPYGQLSGWERRRVAQIQAEEYEYGCPP